MSRASRQVPALLAAVVLAVGGSLWSPAWAAPPMLNAATSSAAAFGGAPVPSSAAAFGEAPATRTPSVGTPATQDPPPSDPIIDPPPPHPDPADYPSPLDFWSTPPKRLADTRPDSLTVDGTGPTGPVGPGSTITVQVTGRGGVPTTGVGAVAVNITATGATASSYVTAYPAGAARPNASTINPVPGQSVATMAIIKLGMDPPAPDAASPAAPASAASTAAPASTSSPAAPASAASPAAPATVAPAVHDGTPNTGAIALYNHRGDVHLVVDVIGWFPSLMGYTGVAPARLADTRTGSATIDGAGPSGAIGPGATTDVPVLGRGGVPEAGVDAVAVVVTATGPTANTYLTAYPASAQRPTASVLNPLAGQTLATLAIVSLGPTNHTDPASASGSDPASATDPASDATALATTERALRIFNAAGSTHVVVDVVGWFAPGDGSTSLTPARLADTRPGGTTIDGAGPSGPVGPEGVITVPVLGRGGVPDYGVGSVAVTITATGPTESSYITAYAGPSTFSASLRPPPPTSTLNPAARQTVANMTIVPVGALGSIALFNAAGSVHLIVDVVGWFPKQPVPPSAPTITAAHRGDTTATIDFSPPADRGGSYLITYEYSLDGGATWTPRTPAGIDSPLLITGLANGTTYSVSLRAVTIAGPGAASAPVDVTPAPTIAATWGDNDNGRLGDGTTAHSSSPVAVDTTGVLAGTKITSVTAGADHTCALADGTPYCWGKNTAGQLGDGTLVAASSPVAVDTSGVLAGKTITSLVAGNFHTCVLAEGKPYCWGNGQYGQLGNGSTTAKQTTPVAVDVSGVLAGRTITALDGGNYHTCVLADGSPYCWGNNWDGQIGDGTTTHRSTPVAVDTSGVLAGKAITDLATGMYHTCVVADGSPFCWGFNYYGELGDGSTYVRTTPIAVYTGGALEGTTATDITAGGYTTCVLASGNPYCWGWDFFGQVGDGVANRQETVPRPVVADGALAGKTVSKLIVGGRHTCAIAAGEGFCWGLNSYGQVGDASTINTAVPVAVVTSGVLADRTITEMDAGTYHTVALAAP